MKTYSLIALAATATTLHAGTPPAEPAPEAKPEPWIKPTLDIRARYEYRDIKGNGTADAATALTTRERVGLLTAEWYGLSAFVEGEFTQAIVDDYTASALPAGVAGNLDPYKPGARDAIADPETNELNQAWLQWKGFDSTIKGGRQRIIFDNAAFVGNVGWRQNEQTFDGIFLQNQSLDGLTATYTYANRANRIFGSDALGPLRNFAGDMHFFNAKYTGIENTTLTGYAYLMDFDQTAPPSGGAPGYISNNTFGGIYEGKFGDFTLRAEAAYQTDASSTPAAFAGGPAIEDSYYAHLTGTYGLENHSFSLGWEYLDADFVTPLATVHAFNGFADAFIGRRIGLARNPGLSDLYVKHVWKTPFWGVKFIQFAHLFGDNDSDFDYGWEYDAVLAKKFNDNISALAKFAFFEQDTASAGSRDITQFSFQVDYKF